MTIRRRIPLLAGAAAAATLACSTPREPYQAVDKAEHAIERADIGGGAAEHAPLELRLAREKLDRAREKLDDEEYTEARRLAEQALVDVELAQAKAGSETASETARDLRDSIETLRNEATRGASAPFAAP